MIKNLIGPDAHLALCLCVDRNEICNISYKDGNSWRVHKTKPISLNSHFELSKPNDIGAINEVADVSFRLGHYKCYFHTQIDHVNESSIELMLPDAIYKIKRDLHQPTISVGTAKFYFDGTMYTGKMCNISMSGMEIEVKENVFPINMQTVFDIKLHDDQICIDGEVRSISLEHNQIFLGIQFVGLSTSPGKIELMQRLANMVIDEYKRYK